MDVPPDFAVKVRRATAGTPRLVVHCIRMLRFGLGRSLPLGRSTDDILDHVFKVVRKIMPEDLFCRRWEAVGNDKAGNRPLLQLAYRQLLIRALYHVPTKEEDILCAGVSYAKVKRYFAVFEEVIAESRQGGKTVTILIPEFSLRAAAEVEDHYLQDIVALVLCGLCRENAVVYAGRLLERMACRRMQHIALSCGGKATMGEALPFLQGTAVAPIPFPDNLQFMFMPTVTESMA